MKESLSAAERDQDTGAVAPGGGGGDRVLGGAPAIGGVGGMANGAAD